MGIFNYIQIIKLLVVSCITSASNKECHRNIKILINLHLKLNSNSHETDLYEDLNLFRKNVLQES